MRYITRAVIACLLSLVGISVNAATYYVRDSSGTYGTSDGTTYANAFDGSADIAGLAAGDTVYFCGAFDEQVVLPTSGNTSSSIVYDFSCPAGGSGPVTADPYVGTYTGGNAIYASGKAFITVKNVSSLTNGGIYMESSSGQACDNCVVDNVVVNTTTGSTPCISIRTATSGTVPVLHTYPARGIQVKNATVSGCGAGGVFVNDYNVGALVDNVDVDGCCATGNNWGIYLASVHSSAENASCSLSATGVGTSYSCSIAGGDAAGYTVSKVFATTVYNTDKTWLTKNAGATTGVGVGEWDQSGNTIYVNTGVAPSGINFVWNTNTQMTIQRSSATNVDATFDGTGIGFDNGVEDSYILSNYSYNNPGLGIDVSINNNITVAGNKVKNNTVGGISFFVTRSSGRAYNNACISNTGPCLNIFRTHSTATFDFKNNLGLGVNGASDKFIGSTSSSSAVVNTDYNWRYNFGQVNDASIANGSNDVTTNPNLDSAGRPATPANGTHVYPCIDADYGSCLGTPDIGAYQNQLIPYGYTLKPKKRR